jgi:hypothetical protein
MSKAWVGGAEARELGAWDVPERRRLEAADRDLQLTGTPCVGDNGCRSGSESILQESWRVAGVSQHSERWLCVACGVARAREKVGFSEWKGRSAPEGEVLGNNTAQALLRCKRCCGDGVDG